MVEGDKTDSPSEIRTTFSAPRFGRGRHEAQHVLGGHVGGLRADHAEKDAEVMGMGPHRGRPGTP